MNIEKSFRVIDPTQDGRTGRLGLRSIDQTVQAANEPIEGMTVSDSCWGAFDAAVRGVPFNPTRTQPIRINPRGEFA